MRGLLGASDYGPFSAHSLFFFRVNYATVSLILKGQYRHRMDLQLQDAILEDTDYEEL